MCVQKEPLLHKYQSKVLVMCKLEVVVLLALLVGVSFPLKTPDNSQTDTTCPPWTWYGQNHTCNCAGDKDKIVYCSHIVKEIETGVLVGFCMTWNTEKTEIVLGSCPFNINSQTQYGLYVPVPNDSSRLDKDICGYTQRTGQLCGQCVNGTSPPVYSYYPQCVDCPAGTNNWAKYLAVSLLPTTLFFIGAMIFRLRATSPKMNGFILFCQVLSSPELLKRCVNRFYKHNYSPNYLHSVGNIYISYVSIWNLDFFRVVYSPFCLHPDGATLQVLSLDYIIAAYPLLLIILTYMLVTLHYHNYRLVVWLWRPFLRCCIRFRRQWHIRNSLVDAFATFLLLSYVKFLSVSSDILTPSLVWNMMWTRQSTVLYYDGSVKYFSGDHLPYAILAITVLLVFTLLPILLLCLYPCRCFQRCLNNSHMNCQVLHMLMDGFLGCYKDGTNGTRDCRYFAAFYLFSRVVVHVSLVFTFIFYCSSILIAQLVIMVLLLSSFKPYKEEFYNQLDIFLFVSLILFFSSAWVLQDYTSQLMEPINRFFLLLLAPIPVAYPLCLVVYHLRKKSGRLHSVTEWIKALLSQSQSYQKLEDSLPRRVIMDEAEALLKRKGHS